MRIKTRQNIDRTIGPLVCWVISLLNRIFFCKKSQLQQSTPEKILIIKFWGLGSILIASSGIYSVKKNYPTAKIYFLTLSRNIEIMNHLGLVDYIFTINVDAGLLRFISDIIRVVVQLRKERLDIVIDLEFFTRFSAIISYLSGARVITGFYDWNVYRGQMHTIKVPFNRYWHVKKNFENLISQSFGPDFQMHNFVFPVFADDVNSLKDILSRKGISHEKFIIININVGDLSPERRWPLEHFAKLTKTLIEQYGLKIVFIGSKSERTDVEKFIAEKIDNPFAVNLAGDLTVGQLAALIKLAQFTITNDSGPLHLAAAVGGKTVSFFGPETPVLYGPIGGDAIIFFKSIDCSPCINVHTGKMVKCSRTSPRCLESISPEEVIMAVVQKGWL